MKFSTRDKVASPTVFGSRIISILNSGPGADFPSPLIAFDNSVSEALKLYLIARSSHLSSSTIIRFHSC
jgi:hypothetical protein